MKSLAAYVWKRRWCRIPLWLALLFGIACLHPFVRQFVFGPTIEGVPWCVWESRLRTEAHAGEPKSSLVELCEGIGLIREDRGGFPFNAEAALPVYMHLAEDRDPAVRKLALEELGRRMRRNAAAILPVLRRHVRDDDADCRLVAAFAVWRATEDPELQHVAASLVYDESTRIRYRAVDLLGAMAKKNPETFAILATLTEDADPNVQTSATFAMHEFGARADAVLRARLKDSNVVIRRAAIIGLVKARNQNAEFSPDLNELLNDPDPSIRAAVIGLPKSPPPNSGPAVPRPKFRQKEPPP